MFDSQEAQTVGVKVCHACSAALLERDRFCRLCGTRQPDPSLQSASLPLAQEDRSSGELVTNRLQSDQSDPYRPVSGPLVKAVVAGIMANTASPLHGRVFRRAVLALISLPIWMIILLLSPLDAYAAARTISGDL